MLYRVIGLVSVLPEMNISAAAYAIKVKPSRSDKFYETSDINGVDMLDLVYNFVQAKSAPANSEEDQTLLKTVKFEREDRVIHGLMELGKYGYAARGVNVKTEKTSYKRKKNDAEMLPFYFMIYLPKGQESGILLTQRFGHFGLFTSFSKQLKTHFNTSESNSSLLIEPIVTQSLIDQMEKASETKKIRFRKYEISSDIANQYQNTITSENAYVEYSIIAKKGFSFRMKDLLSGSNSNHNKILSIENFSYDEALIEVSLNGKKRTIMAGHPEKIRSYYDIHKDVEISSKTGHPSYDSLFLVFTGLKDDMWNELVGVTNGED